MLRELHIQNLAVIQDITVELHPGFNCFTGQTGAGKSLIIGALEILLGLRQATDILRRSANPAANGPAEGRVTGVFHIQSRNLREEIANATDLPLEDEPELIIARRLFESGRTSASLNGQPITGAMLKQVGEILVDVHGQHDAQFLLKPANQLAVIDEFGSTPAGGARGQAQSCLALRGRFSDLFRRRQQLLIQQQELTTGRNLRCQQLELYEFQATEIDEAGLIPGELEQLTARGKLLSNLQKIKRSAGAAYGTLYEDEGSIIERLKSTVVVLLELAEMDESLQSLSGQIREAAISLDDAAFSLRRYVERLDLDPDELNQVTERLNLLNRLVDKYAGRGAGGMDELLAYRRQIGTQIDALRSQDAGCSSIGREIEQLEGQLRDIGRQLTAARRTAAARLAPLVHRQFADLGMKEARFLVDFQPLDVGLNEAPPHTPPPAVSRDAAAGDLKLGVRDFADLGTAVGIGTATGMETVEFMIAPNPGQPPRPLRRIASGGELSRVMLALKGILAQADRVSVLVFDEIDANVGGRMGSIIGEKLRGLASIHQVLCITHLPQIAAFADRHLTIRKQIVGSETLTSVTLMEGDDRLRELAEMTGGRDITAASMAQARELLTAARTPAQKAAKARK